MTVMSSHNTGRPTLAANTYIAPASGSTNANKDPYFLYTTAGSYEAAFNSALVPVASAASGVIKPPNEDPPKETTLMVSSFATLFVEPGFLCSNKVIGLNESSVLLLLPGSGLLGPTQLPLIGLWVVGLVVGLVSSFIPLCFCAPVDDVVLYGEEDAAEDCDGDGDGRTIRLVASESMSIRACLSALACSLVSNKFLWMWSCISTYSSCFR